MKALRTLSLTMYKIAHAHKTPMLEGHLRQERHRTTKGDYSPNIAAQSNHTITKKLNGKLSETEYGTKE